MTRKHFEALAKLIANAERKLMRGDLIHDAAVTQTLDIIATDLADFCAAQNPRFDRARFLSACGLAEDESA